MRHIPGGLLFRAAVEYRSRGHRSFGRQTKFWEDEKCPLWPENFSRSEKKKGYITIEHLYLICIYLHTWTTLVKYNIGTCGLTRVRKQKNSNC
jgi:hypothetical protein